ARGAATVTGSAGLLNRFDERGGEGSPTGGTTAATTAAPEQLPAAEEARALLADLRGAAADGRFLARRYAELLTQAVDDYCGEFEKRAEAVLQRLQEAK